MSDRSGKLSEPRYTLAVEKDVPITMRDGAVVYANVYRPAEPGTFPALVNISVYQKDKVWVPPPDLGEKAGPYMSWETANPEWWVPRGYACVRVDARGSGKSPGESDPGGWQETLDYYDAIEWAAREPWCSGSVGGMGVSYHAIAQWRVAGLQPPSLKAIIPWEGWGDGYRDAAYHGGIFAIGFLAHWHAVHMANHLLGKPQRYNPDAFHTDRVWQYMKHNLDRGWWESRGAQWDRIEVPLYAAGNWAGVGLHLRGATEGYTRAASRHKKLRIHAGTHFHPFYSEDGRTDQLRFLDYWLKGLATGIMDEPPIKLQIRTGGGGEYAWRYEYEWPLARTRWTKYHLHVDMERPDDTGIAGRLEPDAPARAASVNYPATVMTRAGLAAGTASAPSHAAGSRHAVGSSFVTAPLAEDTEVTGPIVLALCVSSTTEDMDVFATLRNIAPDGSDVVETGPHGHAVPMVTKGWLRLSHRKLDPRRSQPYRPYHAHDERQPLVPGEPVRCLVEIWPTSMVFRKGHRIRLDIQPFDGVGSSYTHYHAEYNNGTNTIHTGAGRECHLLLPIIPPGK